MTCGTPASTDAFPVDSDKEELHLRLSPTTPSPTRRFFSLPAHCSPKVSVPAPRVCTLSPDSPPPPMQSEPPPNLQHTSPPFVAQSTNRRPASCPTSAAPPPPNSAPWLLSFILSYCPPFLLQCLNYGLTSRRSTQSPPSHSQSSPSLPATRIAPYRASPRPPPLLLFTTPRPFHPLLVLRPASNTQQPLPPLCA